MKKRYLIMLIIAIILIICLGASLAYAYFFTDIFKNNKQLFSQYISQNLEILELFNDEDIKAYSKKQKNSPFTSEGSIKTNVTFPDSSEAKVANALQNCNITFTGKTDNLNKYMHQTVKANYSDTQSLQFDIYQNGDIYAGKINEVLSKYIGIENNNLKEFATKMQLPEQVISSIPNKIDLNEIEKSTDVFSDEEKNSLKEKYLKIITDNLTDDMFSKEKSSDENIYVLTITEEQLKNIRIKILESLKDDETIINKFKEFLINKYNFTEDTVQTYITQYKKTIQEAIDNSDFSSDSNILERASKVREQNEQYLIQDKIKIVYSNVLAENIGVVEKEQLQVALEEEFGIGKVTDLADDFSTVKIDGKEYSITGSSTNLSDNTTESSTDYNDESKNSSNNIVIKVHSKKNKLSKTEINITNTGDLVISKSDDGVKFEIIKDNNIIASAYAQKLKSPNETRFEFAISNADSEICNLTTSFSGLDTNSVNESSEFSFDIDLGNSMITNAKTKFVSTYKNTKTFGEIQKDDIQASEILLLNTAPARANIEQLYKNIETRFNQVNTAKLQALGLTNDNNPFIYYIPSIVPAGTTYIIQNPEYSPYLVPPVIIGGISVSMLAGNNSILTKASEAKELSSLTKQEIEAFNSHFESFSGNKSFSEVKLLYSSVITSNTSESKLSNSNRIVKINNELPKTIPSNLDSKKTYTVLLEYDEDGYVNNIVIK